MHPATASISVKLRGMKEDIDISKRWTGHFLISYRSRDIYLDCGSFINISDWIVQKINFTETIIYRWSSLIILLTLQLMVHANLYFKDIGSTQTSIFSPYPVFHFLHYSQQSLYHVYFLQFSWSLFGLHTFTLARLRNFILITTVHFWNHSLENSMSSSPLGCDYISLWNLQIALVTLFPRVIIITLVLFGQSKAAYWQRSFCNCIDRKLFANRSQWIVSLTLSVKTWTYRNGHVYYHRCQGRKLQRKNFVFIRRKIDEEELLLMIA